MTRKAKIPEVRNPEARLSNGRFAPDTSGNPGGISREKRDFLERLQTDDADETYEAMMDLVRERNPMAVLRAWEYIVGKPKERVELTGKDGGALKGELVQAIALVPQDPQKFANIARVLEESGVFALMRPEKTVTVDAKSEDDE